MKTTLEIVAAQLGGANVPYLVVGGWAVGAHGASRMTKDADILIDEATYAAARACLEQAGFREWRRNHLVARFEHADVKHLQVIDLMFASSDTFQKMLRGSVEATIEGQKHRVPNVSHLLAMKLHALKQGDENRRSRDVGDVLDLVRLHGMDIRSEDFRALCMQFGGASVYDYLITLTERP